MEKEIIALKECWGDILPCFKEHRFTPEELEVRFIREGSAIFPIFHKRFFDEIRRVNEKNRADLGTFFELEIRPEPLSPDDHYRIITKRGWIDLSMIQCAMAFARPEFASEKRKRIEERKIMLGLELEDAIKNHKDFGYKGSNVFYKKGNFYAKVHFSRRDGCAKKIPKPWENKRLFSPEGLLEEFKEHLDTLS